MSRHEFKVDRSNAPRRSAFPGWAVRVLVLALLVGVRLAGGAIMGHWFPSHRSYWNHNARGNDDYGRGDWGGAVAEYSQMVQIDPHRMDGYALRGMAYFKMGRYRLAAADHREAIALTPSSENAGLATSYQNLAYSEDYYGDHRQAIRDFTTAIRLDPSIPDKPGWTADADDDTGDSHKGRMWAYYATHQYALALKDCDALIARHPYPSSLAVRGKINREASNLVQARADFDAAIRQAPHLVNAYAWEEDMLVKHGETAAALALAQTAVNNNPGNIIPIGGLGWNEYEAGQYSQAIATDQQVLARDGSQAWVRYNLGLVYAVQGNWSQARTAYAEALRSGNADSLQGGVSDVRDALKAHPNAALRQALAMLQPAQTPPQWRVPRV